MAKDTVQEIGNGESVYKGWKVQHAWNTKAGKHEMIASKAGKEKLRVTQSEPFKNDVRIQALIDSAEG